MTREELAAALAAGRSLALIGFMTAGKTQVGLELQRLTGLPFVDVDAEIERREGMSVHRIFERSGEARFRETEAHVLRELLEGPVRVLGCGGGTIVRADNRAALAVRAVRIWLRVSESTIHERLARPDGPRRPLLGGKDARAGVAALVRERGRFYRECDLTIETDGRAIRAIALEIARALALPHLPDRETAPSELGSVGPEGRGGRAADGSSEAPL